MAGLDWLVQDGALGGMFKVWGVGCVVVLQAWNPSAATIVRAWKNNGRSQSTWVRRQYRTGEGV